MTDKIKPTKRVPRFEKYNCSGKLRVDVKVHDGEISEIITMPKKGGCQYNLELVARLITFILECNIDINYLLSVLEDNSPCPAPIKRMMREKLSKEECGLGGCSKIILQAMKEQLDELEKQKK